MTCDRQSLSGPHKYHKCPYTDPSEHNPPFEHCICGRLEDHIFHVVHDLFVVRDLFPGNVDADN